MTDFDERVRADRGEPARAVVRVDAGGLDAWVAGQPARARAAAAAARFTAKPHTHVILPGEAAGDWSVAAGVADTRTVTPWDLAAVAAALPAGTYRADAAAGPALLGWLLAQHRFTRYRAEADAAGARVWLSADPAEAERVAAVADAVAGARDLIDTPANDMGPAELDAAVRAVAARFGAKVTTTVGEALRDGFPAIHAVGRAASRAPRLIDMSWGDPSHPKLTLVGKGVCFDSGGLDIKPAAGMALMKKDMGGAAHALALARLVMGARLAVRLRLLIPAVENAISGDAMRPGDVIATRAGKSIEIGNTDAEGRLILADALTLAVEDAPALLIDFATLTGAARVALGPDLPAMFTRDDALAGALTAAGTAAHDPVWRLPLWTPYLTMLKSGVADLNNAGEGGQAGAVTAALFLAEFVPDTVPWVHFDVYGWRPAALPGRPKGGDTGALQACFDLIKVSYAR